MRSVVVKKNRFSLSLRRRATGFSILEALVSMVIVGIVIGGITELLWANTAWMAVLNNKFDTFFAAKRFLKELERNVRQSTRISTDSTGTNLVLFMAGEGDFDSYGFLTSATPYYYWVEIDNEPGYEGQYIIKAGPTNLLGGRVVLKGVCGPKGIADGQPKIFQYIDKDKTKPVSENAFSSTQSLIVNLELKRNDFGKAFQDGSLKTGLAMRHEIFLRNGRIHGQ